MNCRETTFPNHSRVIMENRFIGQLNSQRSIPDPKCGNVTNTPQPFTFGPQFLVVQTQTLIDENFSFPGRVHRFRF